MKWDEATWESKRQEFATAKQPYPDFPFPGYVATDKLHWLRAEFGEATTDAEKLRLARELLSRAEAAGDTAEAVQWRAEVRTRVPEIAPAPRPAKECMPYAVYSRIEDIAFHLQCVRVPAHFIWPDSGLQAGSRSAIAETFPRLGTVKSDQRHEEPVRRDYLL